MRKLLYLAAMSVILTVGACSQAKEKAPSSPDSAAPAASAPAETTAAESPPAESTAAPSPAAAAPAEAAAPAAGLVTLAAKNTDGQTMSGDPERGRRIFAQCQTCHTLDAGVNRVGPSLHGVIGRHSGSVPGFNYSQANRNSGIVWSEQEIFDYLENPQRKVPGTRMTFVGLRNPQQRADVIAYIKTHGGE